MKKNRLLRMDNVGIVVESLDETVSFFTELGLKLEGRAMIEGEWAGRVTGLRAQRVEIAMMVTSDEAWSNRKLLQHRRACLMKSGTRILITI